MQPEGAKRITGTGVRPGREVPGGFRWRGTPSRELFLVKLAFWAVVAALVLIVLLVLWLAMQEPSQDPFIPESLPY